MKAHKAKIKGNEGLQGQKQSQSKEMKAHNAKMKRNEGPKCQKLRNGAGPGAVKFFVWEIWKTYNLWQLVGGPYELATKKSQNARKSMPTRPKWKEIKATRPKCKEIKAHKAKIKGNKGPQGQNERKSKPRRPKWKEMKAHKAKIKGNEGPQGQNERKWRPKRPKSGKWSRSRRC